MSEEDDYREYERECEREDQHWLDEQIEEAVAAEKERCAKICEAWAASLWKLQDTNRAWPAAGYYAAAAIECATRIRGEK